MTARKPVPGMTFELFVLPPHIANAPRPLKGLFAAPPGTGPIGETCGSCANLYRKEMGKTYLKCLLTRAKWTGGGGSDVKSRAPACRKWEAKT